MKRTFKKIENEIDYEYPSDGGGGTQPVPGDGDADGQPIPNPFKDLKEKMKEKMESMHNRNDTELTYEEAKEKVGKRIIGDMISKLVDTESGKRKNGWDYYDKKMIARDATTEIEFKIPYETYSMGKNPMAFYFDFSGSCNDFCGIFAEITAGLLNKGAVTYIGGNGRMYYRIDKTQGTVTEEMIRSAIHGHPVKGMEVTRMRMTIAEALKQDNIKKMLAYTDYDSDWAMVEASKVADMIWFSAERRMRDFGGLDQFKGKFFQAHSIEEIRKNLANINNKNYELKCRQKQKGA